MNVVFTTSVSDMTYRHIHFHEAAEATIENVMKLVEALSESLRLYNLEDPARCELQLELQHEFDGKTIAVLFYRISKLVR